MRARWVIVASAVVAALARFPGLFWPIRPDEAGFTLVARAWHPTPDSVYGPYFVDRPPSLIAVYRLSDWLGGAMFIRVVGALACVALVFASAALARAVCRLVGDLEPPVVERIAAWSAVLVTGMTCNGIIDCTAAKGEILGLPLVVTSMWLGVRALERRSALLALAAGLVGASALGLKQNMVGGLLFGVVVLVVSWFTGRVRARDFWRLTGAAAVGAAVPVLATIGWALWAGVHLDALAYAVLGFRGDAIEVLSQDDSASLASRKVLTVQLALYSGMFYVFGWFLLNLVPLLRRVPALTLAALAMVAVDGMGVVLSGSYWSPYLFLMVPSMLLCFVLPMAHHRSRTGGTRLALSDVSRGIAAYTAAALVVTLIGWSRDNIGSSSPGHAVYVGLAIRHASQPGDSIVVFGGRPDVVMASGLGSPYDQLWSLPMRTLDPGLTDLSSVMTGPDAPTWFVEWASLESWTAQGQQVLRPILDQRYVYAGTVCEKPVYRLASDPRPVPTFDCETPYRFSLNGTS